MTNNKIKVLIVDDSSEDIYLIRELLKDITAVQYELFHEKLLNSALELLQKEKFDCILLDLNLPDSLGTNTLKSVLNQCPELPIVVLTILDDEDLTIQSLRDGAEDYLVKGKINGEIISRSIRHAIERKKVENALRESEKKYRNIVDTTLEGLWMVDIEGRTTYVNKQLTIMLGYTEYELLEKPFFNFVYEPILNDAKQFFERRKKGVKDRYDFRFIKKDGSILWVIVSASPIFDEKGKFTGAIGLLTDITERKLMEQSLEKSIKEWDSTFNAIADTVCIVDLDGKVTHCNDAAEILFKKACKEIIGKNCWEVLTCPSDRLKDCPIIKAKKSKKREALTVQVHDKWYHSSVDPITDKKGNIIGGVHIISDITKYKLSQDALKESELALKKSQKIAHIGHWIWNTKNNKLIWSDEMFNIFGISKEEFEEFQADLDKIIDRTIHPEDIQKVRESNEKVKLEGQIYPLEYRIIWPDNTIHTAWAEPGEKFTNGLGEIVRLFGIVQDITERKQAEEKLRKSEDNLKEAQRVAHAGNWEWDIKTGKIKWSEETFRLFGLDPNIGEPTYEEHLKYYIPEDVPILEKAVRDAVENGIPYMIVCRAVLPNRTIRHLEIKGEAIHDKKGDIIKLFGTAMDITEYRHAMDALKDSEEKWRLITENSASTILTTDINCIIQSVNHITTTTTISKEQVIGTSIFDYISDKCKQSVKECIERIKKTKQPDRYYVETINPDGNIYSFDSNVGPIIKLDKVVGFVISSSDITEQKKAQDMLKESEELYRTTTEYSNDMIWRLDTEERITFFNKHSEQISGYTSKDVRGKYFSSLVIKEDSDKVKDIFYLTLIGKYQQYEVTFINKNNKHITLSVNTAPIYSRGQIIGTISSGRDITETVKYARELKVLNEKLETSNKELQDFAYIASHDLQEPLRSIYSFTELIANRYKGRLDPDADKFIDYIVNGTKRMQDMISDLLALSRVGTRGKEFVPTNVSDILNNVFKNLHSMIERNNAVITIDDDMPIINADSIQLTQLFQNLIDNAIKFRREETPNIHISAKQFSTYVDYVDQQFSTNVDQQFSTNVDRYAKQENDEWIFSVKDNGIGISERDSKKLFKAFSRLHSRDKYPGTGIGLAICKRIVERHNGRIWLESKFGEGSTFYFTIPIYQNKQEV